MELSHAAPTRRNMYWICSPIQVGRDYMSDIPRDILVSVRWLFLSLLLRLCVAIPYLCVSWFVSSVHCKCDINDKLMKTTREQTKRSLRCHGTLLANDLPRCPTSHWLGFFRLTRGTIRHQHRNPSRGYHH